MSNTDLQLERLHAQIWAAFGEGAGMPFEAACVDAAIRLGYYASIERNQDLLTRDPEMLAQTRNCATRAGNLAAFLAREEPPIDHITEAHFEQACEDVRGRVTRVRERILANALDPQTVTFGGGCG